jgi:hypothetical protein
MRTDPPFHPPTAQPLTGREPSGPKPEQDPPKRGRFKWETGRAPETKPSEYDDDAWM